MSGKRAMDSALIGSYSAPTLTVLLMIQILRPRSSRSYSGRNRCVIRLRRPTAPNRPNMIDDMMRVEGSGTASPGGVKRLSTINDVAEFTVKPSGKLNSGPSVTKLNVFENCDEADVLKPWATACTSRLRAIGTGV